MGTSISLYVYLKLIVVLASMIAVLIIIFYILKKTGIAKKISGYKKSTNGRMEVMDSLMIDNKTKVVLIRRDQTESLLLLQPQQCTVIESKITHDNYEKSFKESLKKANINNNE